MQKIGRPLSYAFSDDSNQIENKKVELVEEVLPNNKDDNSLSVSDSEEDISEESA